MVHRSLARKTAALMERTIAFIDSDDFRTVSRRELLAEPCLTPDASGDLMKAPHGTPPYLASLYEFPLLTREQEFVIFRKMHYLKYEAAQLQRRLSLSPVNSRRVRAIESRLQEANEIRNRIVQCNLRLVVSIAKTLVDTTNSLDDLISEGNFPLMRAAEIFDFTRGLRFSTYATWAVRNGLYRAVHRSRRQRDRFHLEEPAWMVQAAVSAEMTTDDDDPLEAGNLAELVSQLDPRSQTILRGRFGLDGQERPAKFRELAAQLRLSSERVRQLLDRALKELRNHLSTADCPPREA